MSTTTTYTYSLATHFGGLLNIGHLRRLVELQLPDATLQRCALQGDVVTLQFSGAELTVQQAATLADLVANYTFQSQRQSAQQNWWNAPAAPTATQDANEGFGVGSMCLSPGPALWRCHDSTVGAAQWHRVRRPAELLIETSSTSGLQGGAALDQSPIQLQLNVSGLPTLADAGNVDTTASDYYLPIWDAGAAQHSKLLMQHIHGDFRNGGDTTAAGQTRTLGNLGASALALMTNGQTRLTLSASGDNLACATGTTICGRDIASDGSALDAHVADASKHRQISDGTNSATVVWSGSYLTSQLAAKAAGSHTHTSSEITDWAASVTAHADVAAATIHAADPTKHRQIADGTNSATVVWSGSYLTSQLAAKAAGSHTHTSSQITDWASAITTHTDVAAATTHAADPTKHRQIADGTNSATVVWSGSYLTSQLATKAASSHTHAAADIASGTFADARISSSSVLQHLPAFGREMKEFEHAAEWWSTSTSWQTKLYATTTSLPAGTYLIWWAYEMGHERNDRTCLTKLEVHGTIEQESEMECDYDYWVAQSGFVKRVWVGGAMNLGVYYKSSATDGYAMMRRNKLLVQRME